MDKWDEINKLWEDYFKLTVYKNDHLLKPLLHFWLGAYLTQRYVILLSGQYKTLRIHPAIFQNSGSGKSTATKTTHFLLKDIGLRSFFTLKTTDASLIGSIEFIKNKKHRESGLLDTDSLSGKDTIFWDEASILLKNQQYTENICDILQMATDDPGYVAKAVRLGQVEFRTNTSICVSSYLEENIEKGILKRGLFQRMFVVYHCYSQTEMIDFIGNKAEIINSDYRQRKDLAKKIFEILPHHEMPLKTSEKCVIRVNQQAYRDFSSIFVKFIKSKLNLFTDKRQIVFETFVSRNDQIIIIAAHKTILDGRNEVNYDDLMYGLAQYKTHLKSINELLFEQQKVVTTEDEHRKTMIINVIRGKCYGIYETKEALLKLQSWNLGQNNTLKAINKLITDGVIKTELKEHGKKVLLVS